MSNAEGLRRTLQRIDGRGYRAYKDIQGSYEIDGLSLHIDHVQGDPFAAPSKVRVRVPMRYAQLPSELIRPVDRRRALADFLAREVQAAILHTAEGRRGSGKSGQIAIDPGEMGAGHQVTALYEIVPPGAKIEAPDIDPLRYKEAQLSEAAQSGELLTLKIRYKDPEADDSRLMTTIVSDARNLSTR